MKKYVYILLLVIIFAALAGSSGFFYWKYQKELKQNPQREMEAILKEVSVLMQLPEGTPTLATVADKTKLQDQAVFANAENGDKVLIYIEKQKAILYRPSTKKIIDVIPIRANTESATPAVKGTSQTAAQPTVAIPTEIPKSITILNGTTTPGISLSAEKKLSGLGTTVTVADRRNAANTSYPESMVIDLSGKNNRVAQNIAQALSVKVDTTFPEGETKPSSDIVVILGSDFKE